ncbi:energy transducer TonB [Pelagerythrobacter sp.]|uniref:energy transducer TonB n=1 Tax=Pelagerythrobacter sp. TaxID=2800702 RepID=UPI0035AE2D85
MRGWIAISLALASGATGTAAARTPPPPIVASPVAGENQRLLLTWRAGEARCNDGVAQPEALRRPLNRLVLEGGLKPEAVTYGFEIDSRGRTRSIAKIGEGNDRMVDDVAPALAASRFALGRARAGCIVTFTPETASLSAAPVPELVSYTMNPGAQRLPREASERIGGDGNCIERPFPAPLLRAYPDFEAIRRTPGARDWAMVGYDLDAAGAPIATRIVTGTGNAALDQAALEAVGDSRFTEGSRTGCRYPYWLAPAVLEAPAMPSRDAPEMAESAACSDRAGFTQPPRLILPDAYRRRAIEGWAIVRYDVATWGDIGNVEVIDAQPSEDFGKQAVQMLAMAKLPASTSGMTGCVDRVLFQMPTRGRSAENEETIAAY